MPQANWLFPTLPELKVPSVESVTARKTKPAWAGKGGKGQCSVEISIVQQVIGIRAGPPAPDSEEKSNIGSFTWSRLIHADI